MIYLQDATVLKLKEKVKENLSFYQETDAWLGDNLGDLNISRMTPDIQIDVNTDVASDSDLVNAIILHEKNRNLSYELASDENYWTLLTHTSYWNYMRKRWPIEKAEGDPINFIRTRYFFGEKNFYRNGLSRLWWYAHLTYDDTHPTDPYYYTKIALKNQDLVGQAIETTRLSRNKIALLTVLDIIQDIQYKEEEGEFEKIKGKRQLLREMFKQINLIGGVTVWELLSKEEAYEKVWKFIVQKVDEGQIVKRVLVTPQSNL